MHFELASALTDVVTIAAGRGIRDLARLRRRHGPGRWRKCKGVAAVRLSAGVSPELERILSKCLENDRELR